MGSFLLLLRDAALGKLDVEGHGPANRVLQRPQTGILNVFSDETSPRSDRILLPQKPCATAGFVWMHVIASPAV